VAGRRPSYGWAVVAALGVVLAVSVGISFYGVSVYLEALTRGPGTFSLAAVSAGTSAFLLVSGVAGVGVAALLDRVDVRWVLSGGAVLAAAALLALGSVRTPGALVLAYAALGVGFAATGTIPASTLIARWFPRRPAVAMSLAFTGLPVGGAVLTPPIARSASPGRPRGWPAPTSSGSCPWRSPSCARRRRRPAVPPPPPTGTASGRRCARPGSGWRRRR
jgi:MFS family permease